MAKKVAKTSDPISVPAAAKIIGLSRRRVLSLVQTKRIPSVKIEGHGYMIERRDAEEFAKVPRRPGRPGVAKPAAEGKEGEAAA